MYDIAVIGAGPAGATLARLIGDRYRVLIIDRRRLDEPDRDRPKCCGGLLAPDAQGVLAHLGLGLPGHILAGPQLFAVRAVDLASGRERFYQRHYINIDRARFDRWLVSLWPSSVEARFGCAFRGYAPANGGFAIRLARGDKEFTEHARVLVSAEGAVSVLRNQFAPRQPRPRRYVAVQETFHCPNASPHFSALFHRELTDFYGWAIPKDGRILVGAALPYGPDVLVRFLELKARLQHAGFALGEGLKRDGALILRPKAPAEILTGSHGIALIGEAAGWISPSSAEGISWAMKSAVILSNSLKCGLDGFERRYRLLTFHMRLAITSKLLKSPFMYQPWLRNTIMASGLSSMTLRG